LIEKREIKMYMETYSGNFIDVSREYIETARRHQLIEFLELRGTACYDDESTELLRECALEEFEDEYSGF